MYAASLSYRVILSLCYFLLSCILGENGTTGSQGKWKQLTSSFLNVQLFCIYNTIYVLKNRDRHT